ncbi:hypothetical protein AAVH_23384 [Aphelenchoides avenae]|nr:hypothetical protein AAVH_23384 [Aphelenchus avenae]
MKTVISLFFVLFFGVSLLGGERLKCRPKNDEEKKARWDNDKFIREGFLYVYANGKVICPDGSDPEGVVELWEWDMPDNEDDQATNGLCGYR